MIDFFKFLSYRLRKENHLSDITWALAEWSDEFKKSFVEFVFQDTIQNENITEFRREYVRNDSRPDFFFKIGDQEYIIECKINHQHLNDYNYRQQFCNAKIAYIANYSIPQNTNIDKTTTWKCWKSYLENKKDFQNEKLKLIIPGYIKYIKNICNMIEFKKINLNNLSSLHDFNKLVEKTIIKMSDNYNDVCIDNQTKAHNEYRSGKYLNVYIDSYTIYLWIGVYYGDGIPKVLIEIEKRYITTTINFTNPTTHFTYTYNSEEEIHLFTLNNQQQIFFEEEKTDTELQEKALYCFLNEVIQTLPGSDTLEKKADAPQLPENVCC